MAKQSKFKAAYDDATQKLEKAKNDLARAQERVQALTKAIPQLQYAVDSLGALVGDHAKVVSTTAPLPVKPLDDNLVKVETCVHGTIRGERCRACESLTRKPKAVLHSEDDLAAIAAAERAAYTGE